MNVLLVFDISVVMSIHQSGYEKLMYYKNSGCFLVEHLCTEKFQVPFAVFMSSDLQDGASNV